MKKLFFNITLAILIVAIPYTLQAKVGGLCCNCHTMHNSQGGDPMARGDTGWGGTGGSTDPRPQLLIATCLGCHSSTGGSAVETMADGSKIPIVYNTGGYPDPPLAGGNFYYVSVAGGSDDRKGHNIFSDNSDTLTEAPGLSEFPDTCSGQTDSCHLNLDRPTQYGFSELLPGIKACESCHLHPEHHANDHVHLQGGKVDSYDKGWYRFLLPHGGFANANVDGVEGFEDGDWEHSSGAGDHNEYKGSVVSGSYGFTGLGNTMTAYCTGCHPEFHNVQGALSSPFKRHPSDIVIQNSGEYANAFGAAGSGTGAYDPDFPVARSTVPVSPSSTVTLGSDMVMCLSCHRAHGSQYDSILRWDYKNTDLATAFSGCNKCHTTKN
ncbi:MAG: hypothetical protein HWN69_03715 [Desulfobacterales bacterium]|nr:hypothetical protein [Desulfobacterales bacterium]